MKSILLDAEIGVLAAHIPTVHRLSIPGLCPLKNVQLAMSSLLDEIRKQVEKNQLRSILSRSSELNASRFFKISFNADFDFDDELRRFFNFGENEDFRSKLGVNDLRRGFLVAF